MTSLPKAPLLLTKNELLLPIDTAKEKLHEISEATVPGLGSALIREGLFALAVSRVEVMLSDVLMALTRRIPEKLPEKSYPIPKSSLLDNPFSLLQEQIEQYVISLGYKRLDEFIAIFSEQLSINLSGYLTRHGEALQEIKESRNLLLHNDLRTNTAYLSKAGPKSRATTVDTRLQIDPAYLNATMDVLLELCASVRAEVESKYKHYTRAAAIKRLWEYIFRTPILAFDDYWEAREDGETVLLKDSDFHGGMAGSEEIFLGMWLAHYRGGENPYIERFNMLLLDDANTARMVWFIWTLKEFRLC